MSHEQNSTFDFDNAVASVRALAASAIERTDEEMLPALRDIGAAADHIIKLREFFGTAVALDLETEDKENLHQPSQISVNGGESSGVTVEKTAALTCSTDEAKSYKDDFPELNLSTREKFLFEALRERAGAKVAPAELTQLLDSDLTASSRKQAVYVFFKKLKKSPYADHLAVEGETVSRRYIWNPEPISQQPARPVATPTPAQMPARLAQHTARPLELPAEEDSQQPSDSANEEDSADIAAETPEGTENLQKLGVEVCDNGTRYVTINKIPLKLKGFDIDVFLKIAGAGSDGVYYHELLQELDVPGEKTDKLRALNKAIEKSSAVAGEHGINWSDESGDMERKRRRYIVCGGKSAAATD